jgi:hypothetical protein
MAYFMGHLGPAINTAIFSARTANLLQHAIMAQ